MEVLSEKTVLKMLASIFYFHIFIYLPKYLARQSDFYLRIFIYLFLLPKQIHLKDYKTKLRVQPPGKI